MPLMRAVAVYPRRSPDLYFARLTGRLAVYSLPHKDCFEIHGQFAERGGFMLDDPESTACANAGSSGAAPEGEGIDPLSRTMIEGAVAQVFAVDRGHLRGASRGRAPVASARQVAMYLAHVGLSLSLTEVGHLFARDRTTVAHACAVVEDRRDDPTFDRVLDCLERIVRHLLTPRPVVFANGGLLFG